MIQNRWIPQRPTDKQATFLTLPVREALYGGAAGGGKSSALLMAALQYVDRPKYAALILRRTYADLALPDAIMDRAHQWLGGTAAHWSEVEKTYTFPSGATLTFGYLQYSRDKYRYQGSAFQFVGFDELTQFEDPDYRYLFSRLRRLAGTDVPVRMRGASNPGGIGHEWVFERFFVTGRAAGRWFVPAKLADNPHLDREEYEQSLSELDPITRAQLLNGLWVVDKTARWYRREWWRGRNRFDPVDGVLARQVVARWLSIDTALKDTKTAAYSASTVFELLADYRLLVRRVWREKVIFPDLCDQIEVQAAQQNKDGKLRGVILEDRVSGTSALQTLSASGPLWLRPLLIAFDPAKSGGKEQRAQQAAVWSKLGCILLPEPSEAVPWLADFEAELFGAPDTEYKDMIDTYAQGVIYLEHFIAEGHRARQAKAAQSA